MISVVAFASSFSHRASGEESQYFGRARREEAVGEQRGVGRTYGATVVHDSERRSITET